MRTRLMTVVAVLAVGVIGLSACSHAVSKSKAATVGSTTTLVPLASLGLVPAPPHITDQVVLTRTKVRAGTEFAGTLIVTNASSVPVNLSHGCRPDFAVVINNQVIKQSPAFAAACDGQPFMLQPGTNRFAISVITTYFACVQPGGTSVYPIPPCSAGGAPVLPAGRYHTVLYGSGDLPLPEPAPVNVTLTK